MVVVISAVPFESATGSPTDLLSVASRNTSLRAISQEMKVVWKGKGELSLFAMPYYI